MVRLPKAARKLPGNLSIEFTNHNRRAKRSAHEIFNAKVISPKEPLYADLIKITSSSLLSLVQAEITVRDTCTDTREKEKWQRHPVWTQAQLDIGTQWTDIGSCDRAG